VSIILVERIYKESPVLSYVAW